MKNFNNVLFPTLRIFIENGANRGDLSIVDINGNDPKVLLEIYISYEGFIKDFQSPREMMDQVSNHCKIDGINEIHMFTGGNSIALFCSK